MFNDWLGSRIGTDTMQHCHSMIGKMMMFDRDMKVLAAELDLDIGTLRAKDICFSMIDTHSSIEMNVRQFG
jgi:hypothetical protein